MNMNSYGVIAAAGITLLLGAPMAVQARDCEQRVNELERQISELHGQVMQLNLSAVAGGELRETRRTTTGAVFTRVRPVHPDFGESWQDPSGMIWGDVAKYAEDRVESKRLSRDAASAYCRSRGGQLPSREDFMRLREYMGAHLDTRGLGFRADGYTPQVLPNLLSRTPEGGIGSRWLWSSSRIPAHGPRGYDHNCFYFNTHSGVIDTIIRECSGWGEFRCVARR